MKNLTAHPNIESEVENEVEFYNSRNYGLGWEYLNEVHQAYKKIINSPKIWSGAEFGTQKLLLE